MSNKPKTMNTYVSFNLQKLTLYGSYGRQEPVLIGTWNLAGKDKPERILKTLLNQIADRMQTHREYLTDAKKDTTK